MDPPGERIPLPDHFPPDDDDDDETAEETEKQIIQQPKRGLGRKQEKTAANVGATGKPAVPLKGLASARKGQDQDYSSNKTSVWKLKMHVADDLIDEDAQPPPLESQDIDEDVEMANQKKTASCALDNDTCQSEDKVGELNSTTESTDETKMDECARQGAHRIAGHIQNRKSAKGVSVPALLLPEEELLHLTRGGDERIQSRIQTRKSAKARGSFQSAGGEAALRSDSSDQHPTDPSSDQNTDHCEEENEVQSLVPTISKPGAKKGTGMPPLRGLAKNREEAMNAAPSRGLRENVPIQRASGNEGSDLVDAEQSTESPNNRVMTNTQGIDNRIPVPPDLRMNLDPDASEHEIHLQHLEQQQGHLSSFPASSDGLVEATPVTEENHFNLPLADEMRQSVADKTQRREEEREQLRKTMCYARILCLFFVVGISVAVAVAVVVSKKDDSPTSTPKNVGNATNSTLAPAIAPTLSKKSYVFSFLPSYTIETIENEPESPQARAFDWLLTNRLLYEYTEERLLQRYGLATFYYSTNGDDWYNNTNWLHDINECEWYSQIYSHFDCASVFPINGTGASANMTYETFPFWYLAMENNNLRGLLPRELYLVTQLQTLALRQNFLTGSISGAIGQLSNIEDMDFSSNRLTGSLPPEMGSLANLERISLFANEMTNTIPPELARSTSLQHVFLINNKLGGVIPSQLGRMSQLQNLGLSENDLTGSIPTNIMGLPSLTSLVLDKNSLTGSIPPPTPSALTNMSAMYLHMNRLNGTLPSQLGRLTKLTDLKFYDNILTGPFPSQIGLLGDLGKLEAGLNQFTGGIPSELGQLNQVSMFSLWANSLDGTVPSQLGLLDSVTHFWLSDNQLSGSLASELGKLQSVSWFSVEHNGLTGAIPSELGQLTNEMSDFSLYANSFSGAIPSQLGLLGSANVTLLNFWLSENELSGALPTELGHLQQRVLWFSAEKNQLTGPLPSEFGLFANATNIDLWQNNLEGILPSSLGRLSALRVFNVAENNLSGSISGEIAALAVNGTLAGFNLAGNLFEGVVPLALCSLGSGLHFDCSAMLCGCACACREDSVWNNFALSSLLNASLPNITLPGF